jgi:hypothetical protein
MGATAFLAGEEPGRFRPGLQEGASEFVELRSDSAMPDGRDGIEAGDGFEGVPVHDKSQNRKWV